MRTSAVSAALAALCVSTAEASGFVRVRTLSQRKSLLSGRDARGSFLDVEPTFRRLELEGSMSMDVSMSESLSMGSLSIPDDVDESVDDSAEIDSVLNTVVVDAAEKESSG